MTEFFPQDADFARRVQESFSRQRLMGYIGATLVQVGAGHCEIHLPYQEVLTQQNGYFHGGIIATLADNAGGYAGGSLMPADAGVLTVEFKINIVAPADGELLVAQGRVVKAGRTLTISAADVFVFQGGEKTLCATALQTLMILPGLANKIAV